MTLHCEVTGSYLYSYDIALRGLRKLLVFFPFLSLLFKLTFLVQRKDILCAFPFDVQNVAYDSFVRDSRVFSNRIYFRVLGSVSEIVVNGDYSMDKVINLKQIHLYS
jgi:membrane-anchored protein YejM (alkaline phosphatase superfamily)